VLDNLAFLIRYKAGPGVSADRVSAATYTTRGPNGAIMGQKAVVIAHTGHDHWRVVVSHEVTGQNRFAVAGLAKEVDKMVQVLVERLEELAETPVGCTPS
jgi:hypothetical protein